MDKALLHHWKRAREWQRQCANDEPHTRNAESSFGGAWPGMHAIAAWNSARSQVSFRKRLAGYVKDADKRSKAAKKGWKTRRAALA